jgi:hypothetical protein
MGDAVKPRGKGHPLPAVGRNGLNGIEKDLLGHIFRLRPVSYFENYISINPIEVLLI